MPARWFVQTRGSLPTEDYTWRSVAAADPGTAEDIVARGYRGRRCSSLLDGERPGVLLFDDDQNGTVLFVTGLVSPDRPVDYQQREIRLSLLGVAAHDHEPDERDLVAVAVAALRHELTSDLLVSYGAAGGFSFETARWSRFVKKAAGQLADMPDAPVDPRKIQLRKDTDPLRRKTADELGALYLRVGPDLLADRIVILHTNLLDAPDIGRLKAWRTISDIEASPRDLTSPSPIGADAIADVAKAGKAAANAATKVLGSLLHGPGLIISALAIVGIVAVTTFVSLPDGPPPPHRHPAPAPAAPRWRVADVIGSPGGASKLESIVALGPSAAIGAGLTCGPGCPSPGPQLLVTVWNGTAWTRLPPAPAGVSGTPENLAVGASSVTNAWVFDTARTPRGDRSYALHWDGSHWAVSKFRSSPAFSAVAVFSSDDAWAFGNLPDGHPYDLRYDGRQWTRVYLPAVPSSTPGASDMLSVVSRDDMWATATTAATAGQPAASQVHVLLHWDGTSWQPLRLPDLRLAPGEFGVPSAVAALSSSDVWVTGYVSAKTAPAGTFLLHWDGTTWRQVGLPDPGLGLGALAQDGAGGLWLSAGPAGRAAGLPGSLYHYSDGRWSSQPVTGQKGYSTLLGGLSWIPGTRSLWARGVLEPASPAAGYQAVILRYGG